MPGAPNEAAPVVISSNRKGREMQTLKNKLKQQIIETLDLVDLTPDEMEDQAQLVGGDFGIDSIDVLELVIMLEQEYGVSIDTKELGEKVFRTLETLVQFVADNRKS